MGLRETRRKMKSYQRRWSAKVKAVNRDRVEELDRRLHEDVFQDLDSGDAEIWDDGVGTYDVA